MKQDDSLPLMVTIRCITYNHEHYIRQCLEGFVKQKTNFRFEAIVHDDASTDGTVAIIREYAEKYPDIIKPIYEKENQYSKGNGILERIMDEHTHGKYVALCEGDDYWIDPLKIQKQVDYMEAHPDYSMCFHTVYYEEEGKIIKSDLKVTNECDYSVSVLIHEGGLFCASCSLLFQSRYAKEYPTFRKKALEGGVGDSPLQILLGLRGRIHYFPDIMGTYRYGSMGSWTSMNRENRKRQQAHLISSISWYRELDNYTNGQYKHAIFYRVCLCAMSLYRDRIIKRKELLSYIQQLKWGREKIRYCLSFFKIEISRFFIKF